VIFAVLGWDENAIWFGAVGVQCIVNDSSPPFSRRGSVVWRVVDRPPLSGRGSPGGRL